MAVGDDFSENMSAETPFPAGANLTKRVPWAVEPACQSCHTGDALNPNHPNGAIVADDGIRLLQAFADGSPNAPFKVPNSRFAETQVVNGDGQTVDLLYRVSKEHGGVMCEGCHGSTHAIWPNANPNANDNVTSNQLQGHSGTIIECTTCHTRVPNANETLDGPHGMHVVGNTDFARGDHEGVSKDNPQACQACHGVNGEGTVLSRMATDRLLECKNDKGTFAGCDNPGQDDLANFPQNHEVSCQDCHENELLDILNN